MGYRTDLDFADAVIEMFLKGLQDSGMNPCCFATLNIIFKPRSFIAQVDSELPLFFKVR